MKSHELKYFKFGAGICATDFENKLKTQYINLDHVSSYSDLLEFSLPLSGKPKGLYAIVTMVNGDRFFIHPNEHEKLKSATMQSTNLRT